jgi:beta-galactosidase
MVEAHWNAISVGIFSWVSLEPEEGTFTMDWLGEILDIEASAGRVVGLATPSAAAPAWLSKKYPETLRVGADGVRRKHGNRVNYCWTSPVYREKTRMIAEELARRFGSHPAVAYWHISNEYGGECCCDLCQAEFRNWLRERYRTLDALNAAYWSKFWGHTFTDWEQIEAPGDPHGDNSIIALMVDWKRFVSSRIVDFYRHEVDAIRSASDLPVTTNLMGTYPVLNSWDIAPYLDFAAWDSYPWFGSTPQDINSWIYTSFCHDLCRSLKGKPFLLMECSPSSSNWYPVMGLKRPNAHKLEGLQAVGHGAEGVQYFQWRQGRGSSEQFHGAVVAHNNRQDARVFKEVAELGKALGKLDGVVGSSTKAKVAILFDWENAWTIASVQAPRTQKRDYVKTVVDHYRPFWNAGIAVDLAHPGQDLSQYQVVVAPMLFMTSEANQRRLARFVEDGGTLVTTYWSAVVDESALAYIGGFPEPLRQALGIWVEEIDALYEDQENVVVTRYSDLFENGARYKTSDLCERIHCETADVLAQYGEDFYSGEPCVTRNAYGKGHAFYIASRNEASFTRDLLMAIAASHRIDPCVQGSWSDGITVQCRRSDSADYLFFLNCSSHEGAVTLHEQGLKDAESGTAIGSRFLLPSFGSRVVVRPLLEKPGANGRAQAPAEAVAGQ